MPNKVDPNKLHSSITLQRTLIAELDRIAMKEDRSRNKVIEMLLVSQLAKYNDSDGLRPAEPAVRAAVLAGRNNLNTVKEARLEA